MSSSPSQSPSVLAKYILVGLFIGALLVIFSSFAFAHPEDDFCRPETGMDPLLCMQLAEIDRSDPNTYSPLLDKTGVSLSPVMAGVQFAEVGVRHILPGGLDHILFVLALFLGASTFRSLIIQMSAFTLAHTVTLGLTAAGIINPPASIVEPLIALSIAVIAIETLLKVNYAKWRLLIIFVFGLFHGMGFAGFIKDIGLPAQQFWSSLIGFNIGVEIGQLAVVLAAALIAWPIKYKLSGGRLTYHRAVVGPCSIVIAIVGLWWFLERSLGL